MRQVLLSLDPTNKIWATEDSYLPAVPLGDVMRGIGIGIVEESRDGAFAPGDVVQGMFMWQLYAISNGAELNKLPQGVPLAAFMGVMGHIGLTAYFGLLDIGKPLAGDCLWWFRRRRERSGRSRDRSARLRDVTWWGSPGAMRSAGGLKKSSGSTWRSITRRRTWPGL